MHFIFTYKPDDLCLLIHFKIQATLRCYYLHSLPPPPPSLAEHVLRNLTYRPLGATLTTYPSKLGSQNFHFSPWLCTCTQCTPWLRICLLMNFLSFFFYWTTFSFLFYQYSNTALSTRTVDGHQIYSVGSVIGKTALIDPVILSTPSLIFTGVKSAKFGLIFNISQLCAACIWKCSNISELRNKLYRQQWLHYHTLSVHAKIDEAEFTHPWKPFSKNASFPKIARRRRAESSITQPRVIQFRSINSYTYFDSASKNLNS